MFEINVEDKENENKKMMKTRRVITIRNFVLVLTFCKEKEKKNGIGIRCTTETLL